MSDVNNNGGATRTRLAIAEEAAEWLVEWRGGSVPADARSRFSDWLCESPVHVEEYLAAARIYGLFDEVDCDSLDVVADVTDRTVVELYRPDSAAEGTRNASVSASARSGRQKIIAFLAACAGFAAVVLATQWPESAGHSSDFATAIGEQRSILLDDGSMVSLNTQSSIDVEFSESRRSVRLLRGEALFDVEEDVDRPFFVETDSAVVRVTGTRFNVYDRNGSTAITVISGNVEVQPKSSPAGSSAGSAADVTEPRSGVAKLAVGDQVIVRAGMSEVQSKKISSLDPVTAWTERRLVIDELPLVDIVAEFNRYNRQQLVVADAAIGQLTLSGVFSTQDPESLLLYLQSQNGVVTEANADGSVVYIRERSASQ